MKGGKRWAYAIIFVLTVTIAGAAMQGVVLCNLQSPSACTSNQARWATLLLAPIVALLIIFAANRFLDQGEE
jgi:hypothetical protein